MEKEKIIKIASVVIGACIALLLIWIGFRIVSRGRASTIPASAVATFDETPTGFKIRFKTQDANTQAFVRYSTDGQPSNLPLIASFARSDSRDEEGNYVYTAELSLLPCGTTIYYTLNVNDSVVTNDGVPFTKTLKCDEAALTPTAIPTMVTQTPSPTQAPTIEPIAVESTSVSPTHAVTPAGNVTDCDGIIKPSLGYGYTALDYARCKARKAAENSE